MSKNGKEVCKRAFDVIRKDIKCNAWNVTRAKGSGHRHPVLAATQPPRDRDQEAWNVRRDERKMAESVGMGYIEQVRGTDVVRMLAVGP